MALLSADGKLYKSTVCVAKDALLLTQVQLPHLRLASKIFVSLLFEQVGTAAYAAPESFEHDLTRAGSWELILASVTGECVELPLGGLGREERNPKGGARMPTV